jgi:GNAT superfamily N-acetyltransferase
MAEADVDGADRIVRLAFGTFLGLPDPAAMFGDADYVRTRWRAAPECAWVAEDDARIVGSNFATVWGSFGFFGPLSVEPALWDKGVAQRLLEPTMRLFEERGCTATGLFTFPQSTKHAGLYQKFGFWARYLTPVMAKPVEARATAAVYELFSALDEPGQARALAQAKALTGAIYPGLDVGREIEAVQAQGLGDTVLLADGRELAAFAVVHVGTGSEAGGGSAYVKFAAARPGPTAQADFERLLEACEAFAAARGADRLIAGVNQSRHDAYRAMLARGFRIQMNGVAMHGGAAEGFCRPDVWVLDDWR